MADADKSPDKAAETDAIHQDAIIPAKDKGKKTSQAAPTIRVRVSSPFKVFYDDEALSLSGENDSGKFDILPHHHNFISLINECELQINTHSGVIRVRISGGIMHVKADQILVFLNV